MNAHTNTTVDTGAVYALRKFKHDNTPSYLRATSAPTDGNDATDHEIRGLLIFAANLARGDLGLPRTLEAVRVIRLVPEDIGAALFGGDL